MEGKAGCGLAVAVAAVLVALLGFLFGQGVLRNPASPESGSGNTAQTPDAPEVPPDSVGSRPPGSLSQPSRVPTVRRTTTSTQQLKLARGYGADLDTMNRDWDVQYAATASRYDLQFTYGSAGEIYGEVATVDRGPDYRVCEYATNYTGQYLMGGLSADEAVAGVQFCVRTSEHRLAWVRISKVEGGDSRKVIDLDVTVWDPPQDK
jgi:hypothetical protein